MLIEIQEQVRAFKRVCKNKPRVVVASAVGVLIAAHVGSHIRRLCQEPARSDGDRVGRGGGRSEPNERNQQVGARRSENGSFKTDAKEDTEKSKTESSTGVAPNDIVGTNTVLARNPEADSASRGGTTEERSLKGEELILNADCRSPESFSVGKENKLTSNPPKEAPSGGIVGKESTSDEAGDQGDQMMGAASSKTEEVAIDLAQSGVLDSENNAKAGRIEEEDALEATKEPKVSVTKDPELEELAAQFQSLCGEDPRASETVARKETLTLEELEARYKALCGTSTFDAALKQGLAPTPSEEAPASQTSTPVKSNCTDAVSEEGKDCRTAAVADSHKVAEAGLAESADTNLILDAEAKSEAGINAIELEATAAIMKSNPGDVELQANGFALLVDAIRTVDVTSILASGIVHAVIMAMGTHHDDLDLQRKGCSALNTLGRACSKKQRLVLKKLGAKQAIDSAIAILKTSHALSN